MLLRRGRGRVSSLISVFSSSVHTRSGPFNEVRVRPTTGGTGGEGATSSGCDAPFTVRAVGSCRGREWCHRAGGGGGSLVAVAGSGSGQTGAGGGRVPHVASSADTIAIGTAEMAAVLKEAETKLVAITWLARCLWVRPPARPCHDRARSVGWLPSRGRAFESERRLGRPNAVRTKWRARARVCRQQEGGREGGRAVGMGAHEHARAAATVIWRGERR